MASRYIVHNGIRLRIPPREVLLFTPSVLINHPNPPRYSNGTWLAYPNGEGGVALWTIWDRPGFEGEVCYHCWFNTSATANIILPEDPDANPLIIRSADLWPTESDTESEIIDSDTDTDNDGEGDDKNNSNDDNDVEMVNPFDVSADESSPGSPDSGEDTSSEDSEDSSSNDSEGSSLEESSESSSSEVSEGDNDYEYDLDFDTIVDSVRDSDSGFNSDSDSGFDDYLSFDHDSGYESFL